MPKHDSHPLFGDWSPEDSANALAEGWDLFLCEGSMYGDLQLQALTDPINGDDPDPPFAGNDEAAWRHVMTGVLEGNSLHVKALSVLRDNAPSEYGRVVGAA